MRLATSLVLALALFTAACSERIGKGWDWNRMRTQPRAEPYGGSEAFADSAAMRTPPPGTVARESTPAESAAVMPAITPALLERGRAQFHVFCAVCHGERGDGASVVASNMSPSKALSLLTPGARTITPAQLYTFISQGAGRMPSFSASLSSADRWAVVAYVAQLQQMQQSAR